MFCNNFHTREQEIFVKDIMEEFSRIMFDGVVEVMKILIWCSIS